MTYEELEKFLLSNGFKKILDNYEYCEFKYEIDDTSYFFIDVAFNPMYGTYISFRDRSSERNAIVKFEGDDLEKRNQDLYDYIVED